MFYQLTTQGVLPCTAGKASSNGLALYLPRDGGGYSADAIAAPAGCQWVEVVDGTPANFAAAVALPVDASLIGSPRHFWKAPEFVKDTNTYGPFTNGQTYATGLIWGTDPKWAETPNANGIFVRRPVGIFAPAECVNSQVRATGDWQDTTS